MSDLTISIPFTREKIVPGNKVRIGRFSEKDWLVCYGWYEFGGNRPVLGWYLTTDDGLTVKPLQYNDLEDIYLIKS